MDDVGGGASRATSHTVTFSTPSTPEAATQAGPAPEIRALW